MKLPFAEVIWLALALPPVLLRMVSVFVLAKIVASNDPGNDNPGSYQMTLAKTPGAFIVP